MGFCFMKPNRPVPVIQPTVVATALPNATSIKIVPWIRSSHRRNVAILEVGWGVVKRLAFIAIFSPPPNARVQQPPKAVGCNALLCGIWRGVAQITRPSCWAPIGRALFAHECRTTFLNEGCYTFLSVKG